MHSFTCITQLNLDNVLNFNWNLVRVVCSYCFAAENFILALKENSTSIKVALKSVFSIQAVHCPWLYSLTGK